MSTDRRDCLAGQHRSGSRRRCGMASDWVDVCECGRRAGSHAGKAPGARPCAAAQLRSCTSARKGRQRPASLLIAKSLCHTKGHITEFTAQLMLIPLTVHWSFHCGERLWDCSSMLKVTPEFPHFADVGPECLELRYIKSLFQLPYLSLYLWLSCQPFCSTA